VFTARYGLNPYITQICFVFERLNASPKLTPIKRLLIRKRFCHLGVKKYKGNTNLDGRFGYSLKAPSNDR
jgi:hypothetical protein